MYSTKEAVLLMSSLSIYKGIMNRSVAKAYYRLLSAFDKDIFEFCNAWGEFFAVLCDKECSESFARALTETALFDENAFSRAASAGVEKNLPSSVLNAVKRDIGAIRKLYRLSPETILNDYQYRDELGSIAENLPRWKTGLPVSEFVKIMSQDCFKKKSKNPVTQPCINTDFFAVFISYKYIYIYIIRGNRLRRFPPLRIYFIYSPVHRPQCIIQFVYLCKVYKNSLF